jgi:hypothetical protein
MKAKTWKSTTRTLAAMIVLMLIPAITLGSVFALRNNGQTVFAAGQTTSSCGPFSCNPFNVSNDTNNAQFPTVATSNHYVYVVWEEAGHGTMIRVNSNDGYPSAWSPPQRLSSLGGVVGEVVITANESYVYVAWAQTTSPKNISQIFFASSSDYGQTFSYPQNVDGQPSVNAITPVLASWGSTVYVGWAEDSSGYSASYVVSSANAGQTWSSVYRFGNDHEPQLAAYGSWGYAISDGGYAYSSNNGTSWTENSKVRVGSEPWIAAYGSHVYIASELKDLNKSAPINMQISSNNGMTFGAVFNPNGQVVNVWEPQIAAQGSNVYLAFRSLGNNNTNPPTTISAWITTSNNFGANWTAPYQMSKSGHLTGWPLDVSISGNYAYTIFGSATTSGGSVWNAYVSYTSNNGSSWTSQPGIDVSNNALGVAAPPTDIESASIMASANGTSAFAAWMQNDTVGSNSALFQIFFNGPFTYQATTTTTLSSSSSSSTMSSDTSSSYSSSETTSSSIQTTTSPTISSTATASSSTSRSNTFSSSKDLTSSTSVRSSSSSSHLTTSTSLSATRSSSSSSSGSQTSSNTPPDSSSLPFVFVVIGAAGAAFAGTFLTITIILKRKK